uniref:cAMP responsive element binding protein 3 like 2 n=1 Tax=Cercocebus atys TaxID=9531 RepID=A0A2K5M8M8_CERAT
MEVLESGEQGVLQWDRKLSELSEPGDGEALMYHTHFSELLDEFSQNVLGQLLNDPFLSEKSVSMEVEPSPTSPAPLIQAEHSYSLCEEPRAQSPFTHVTTSDSFNDDEVESEKWYLSTDFPSTTIKTEPITDEPPPGLVPSVTLTITAISTPYEKEEPPLEMNTGVDSSCQTIIPKIKLEPHEVDQFLNFSPKEGLSALPVSLLVEMVSESTEREYGERAGMSLYHRGSWLCEIALFLKNKNFASK